MLKFIEKNKLFLLILFALIAMTIGVGVSVSSGKAEEYYDGSVEIHVHIKSLWRNANGKTYNSGVYISEDGYSSEEGAGEVSCWGGIDVDTRLLDRISGQGAPAGIETEAYSTMKFLVTEKGYGGLQPTISLSIHATETPGFTYNTMGQVAKEDYNKSTDLVPSFINTDATKLTGHYLDWSQTKTFYVGQNTRLDLYFVALFYPARYTLYYEEAGGEWDISFDESYTHVYPFENYPVIDKQPTKVGYDFDGWYLHYSEHEILIWHPGDPDKKVRFMEAHFDTVWYNFHIYAHWKAKESKVTFDKQGGRGGTDSATAVYGMSLPTITTPALEGHSFVGYFTSPAAGTKYFDSDGKGVSNWTLTSNEITLYAQWTEHTYKIIFNKNSTEASGTMNDMSLSYTDEQPLTANAYTRTGYTFSGWATSDSGAVVYSDRATVCGLTSVDGGTVNLYAVWSENSYTIAFNNNGGTGTMSSKTLTYTESWTLTTNTFTKAGYLFEKWNTKSDGTGSNYLDGASVSKLSSINGATVTLYAKWQSTWATEVVKPSGSGTLAEPYEISSAKNLAWIASQTTGTTAFSKYCKQTANISLSGKTWLPIGTSSAKFTGSYDGNGYVITNINSSTIKNASDNYIYSQIGLFGYTSGATINRVTILSSTMYGHNQVGVLVGSANDSTKISMCQTKGTVTISGQYAGGICGDLSSSSSLTKSVSSAMVNGGKNAGGLVGYAGLVTITSSGFTGTVSGTDCALLVGYASKDYSAGPTITDCFAHGTGSTSFYKGSGAKSITSCLYSSGTTKKYYDGSFTGWVKIGSTTIPKDLAWITSIGESTAKATIIDGYSKV